MTRPSPPQPRGTWGRPPFRAMPTRDLVPVGSTARYQCVSAMPEYEFESPEELRWGDREYMRVARAATSDWLLRRLLRKSLCEDRGDNDTVEDRDRVPGAVTVAARAAWGVLVFNCRVAVRHLLLVQCHAAVKTLMAKATMPTLEGLEGALGASTLGPTIDSVSDAYAAIAVVALRDHCRRNPRAWPPGWGRQSASCTCAATSALVETLVDDAVRMLSDDNAGTRGHLAKAVEEITREGKRIEQLATAMLLTGPLPVGPVRHSTWSRVSVADEDDGLREAVALTIASSPHLTAAARAALCRELSKNGPLRRALGRTIASSLGNERQDDSTQFVTESLDDVRGLLIMKSPHRTTEAIDVVAPEPDLIIVDAAAHEIEPGVEESDSPSGNEDEDRTRCVAAATSKASTVLQFTTRLVGFQRESSGDGRASGELVCSAPVTIIYIPEDAAGCLMEFTEAEPSTVSPDWCDHFDAYSKHISKRHLSKSTCRVEAAQYFVLPPRTHVKTTMSAGCDTIVSSSAHAFLVVEFVRRDEQSLPRPVVDRNESSEHDDVASFTCSPSRWEMRSFEEARFHHHSWHNSLSFVPSSPFELSPVELNPRRPLEQDTVRDAMYGFISSSLDEFCQDAPVVDREVMLDTYVRLRVASTSKLSCEGMRRLRDDFTEQAQTSFFPHYTWFCQVHGMDMIEQNDANNGDWVEMVDDFEALYYFFMCGMLRSNHFELDDGVSGRRAQCNEFSTQIKSSMCHHVVQMISMAHKPSDQLQYIKDAIGLEHVSTAWDQPLEMVLTAIFAEVSNWLGHAAHVFQHTRYPHPVLSETTIVLGPVVESFLADISVPKGMKRAFAVAIDDLWKRLPFLRSGGLKQAPGHTQVSLLNPFAFRLSTKRTVVLPTFSLPHFPILSVSEQVMKLLDHQGAILPNCPSQFVGNWIPCNVQVDNEGNVRILSYINNLHPDRFPHLYVLIETAIGHLVPLFDRVLSCLRATDLPLFSRLQSSGSGRITVDHSPITEHPSVKVPWHLRGRIVQMVIELRTIRTRPGGVDVQFFPSQAARTFRNTGASCGQCAALGIYVISSENIAADIRIQAVGNPKVEGSGSILHLHAGRSVALPSYHKFRSGLAAPIDRTRPGELTWLNVYLLDPADYVPSSEIVIPQQPDWVALTMISRIAQARRLPHDVQESLMEMVAQT